MIIKQKFTSLIKGVGFFYFEREKNIMKTIKLFSSASLLIGATLALAACGQNNTNATK